MTERQRCTRCRNPIRNVAAARHVPAGDAWYHPDCWAEACVNQQEHYERQVESEGLDALLAPYISHAPAANGVSTMRA